MGSHNSKAVTVDKELDGELDHSRPPPSPARLICQHPSNTGPDFAPRASSPSTASLFSLPVPPIPKIFISNFDNQRLFLTYPTIPPRISSVDFRIKTGIAATTFPKFAELPNEIKILIFTFAIDSSIGPQRHDSAFATDLWYTETSLFSTGACTSYPYYMDCHNFGVINSRGQGIGSKVVFRAIMQSNRLARQVVFGYWLRAIKSCMREVVRSDGMRRGRNVGGRPLNAWVLRALVRRRLVLEVLDEVLMGMRGGQ